MFDGLISRFQLIRRKVLGYGRITSDELAVILKDIRVALLEGDVNYRLVKDFIQNIEERCARLELSKSLGPGDLVLKAVYEELVLMLGATPRKMIFKDHDRPAVSLLGLQGAGKTTTAVKLGVKYRGLKPLLVPADIKRPAAFEQLVSLGRSAGLDVYPLDRTDLIKTVKGAMDMAYDRGHKIIIIDTAGRLHVDEELIDELREINDAVKPVYRLLVADGMTGQDAVNQAAAFHDRTGLDGAILTKMDGDTRGGAALSIARIAKVPIFFLCTGEQLSGLEEFYPDRVAQRILGMGDIASLVQKIKMVEADIDQAKIRQKMTSGGLDLEDFLEQMKAVRKLGPLGKIAAMIPGVKESDVDENEMKKIEAMINSMTRSERQNPGIIDGSRKKRIAAGSGTTVQDINQLLKQFSYARDLMKKIGKGKIKGKMPFPGKF